MRIPDRHQKRLEPAPAPGIFGVSSGSFQVGFGDLWKLPTGFGEPRDALEFGSLVDARGAALGRALRWLRGVPGSPKYVLEFPKALDVLMGS